MAVVFNETFSADPGGAFATPLVDSGGVLTATYNGAQQAMDLDRFGFNSVWRLDTCPLVRNSRVVLDLEVLSTNREGAGASSIGFAWYSASQGYWHMATLSAEDQNSTLGRGAPGTPLGFSVTELVRTPVPVPTSGRHTYEFVSAETGEVPTRQVRCLVGGELYAIYAHDGPVGEDLQLGVFIRDATYRLHSIVVHDDGAAVSTPRSVLFPVQELLLGVVTQPVTPIVTTLWDAVGDITYGGKGKIVGTVKRSDLPANVPLARKVRLLRDRDAVCIREMWSDPVTGAYEFVGIDPVERYSVVAYDYQGVFRAVIADNLLPDPL